MISLLALYFNVAKLATNPSESCNVEQQNAKEYLKENVRLVLDLINRKRTFLLKKEAQNHDELINSLGFSIDSFSSDCELLILQKFLILHLDLLINFSLKNILNYKNNDLTFVCCKSIILEMKDEIDVFLENIYEKDRIYDSLRTKFLLGQVYENGNFLSSNSFSIFKSMYCYYIFMVEFWGNQHMCFNPNPTSHKKVSKKLADDMLSIFKCTYIAIHGIIML